MPKLIVCKLKQTGTEVLMCCPNRNCTAKLANVHENSGDYYQCPTCNAVFNKTDGLIPCEVAEKMFPGAIKIAY